MNRDAYKAIIKKLILKEITQADFGVGKQSTNDKLVGDVKKAVGKAGEVTENPLNGKVVVDDGQGGRKFQCEVVDMGDGTFDVTVVTHGSDRKIGKGLTAEKLGEFLRDAAKEDKSAVEKLREKSINSGKGQAAPKKETDKMEDVKEKTQKDLADKTDVKAEEKTNKELAPVNKDIAPALGGEIVDKVEKIVDRLLKDKADAKTAHLKADSKMESPDKLTAKLKDTPALKTKKK